MLSLKNNLCKIKCLLKQSRYEEADLELIRLGIKIKNSHYELRPIVNIKYHLLKVISDFKN
jgi:hypothetical protein